MIENVEGIDPHLEGHLFTNLEVLRDVSVQPDNPHEIVNHTPKNGVSRTYEFGDTSSEGYCIIAYLPNPDHNGSALLIQGTSGEPTDAGGDFLLSEEKMSGFQKTLGVSKFPYFELLLRTSWVKGTPIDSNVVAFRTYPGP